MSRNLKSETVVAAIAKTISSSSCSIFSKNGIASSPILRNNLVKTSAIALLTRTSSLLCNLLANAIPTSISTSNKRARHSEVLTATSSFGSLALRNRISAKPSGSTNSDLCIRSRVHSINSKRRSSLPLSNLARSHLAASTPCSCATTEVERGIIAVGSQSMFCGPSAGCVCQVPGRSAKAIDSIK